jgi:hypothetical protein
VAVGAVKRQKQEKLSAIMDWSLPSMMQASPPPLVSTVCPKRLSKLVSEMGRQMLLDPAASAATLLPVSPSMVMAHAVEQAVPLNGCSPCVWASDCTNSCDQKGRNREGPRKNKDISE